MGGKSKVHFFYGKRSGQFFLCNLNEFISLLDAYMIATICRGMNYLPGEVHLDRRNVLIRSTLIDDDIHNGFK